MALTMQSVCRHAEDIVERQIDNELIIVPVAAGIGDLDEDLYTLTGTGLRVWEMLDGHQSIQAITDSLCHDYEADSGMVQQDIISFCQELARRRLVTIVDDPDCPEVTSQP